jgi:putative tryptophan/tyrosine transport system substrate-binding protein
VSRRGTVLWLLLLGLSGPPLFGSAQTPQKVWRIGSLGAGETIALASPAIKALTIGLADAGLREGRDFTLELRRAEFKEERLAPLAAELVKLKIDIIVVDSTSAAIAAQKAASTIPIVFLTVSDPIAAGFTDNLARPSKNMTGLSNFAGDLEKKRLELLKLAIPKLTRVARLTNANNPYGNTSYGRALRQGMGSAGEAIGVQISFDSWNGAGDMHGVFTKFAREGTQAVLVAPDPVIYGQRQQIGDSALKYRIACIAGFRGHAEAGCVMSYGVNAIAQYRQAASYVARIVKGAKPADLPIEQPTKFELIINLSAAKSIGLTIPQELLLLADEIIQ